MRPRVYVVLGFGPVLPLLIFTFFLVYFSHLIDAFLRPDGQCLWHFALLLLAPPPSLMGFLTYLPPTGWTARLHFFFSYPLNCHLYRHQIPVVVEPTFFSMTFMSVGAATRQSSACVVFF